MIILLAQINFSNFHFHPATFLKRESNTGVFWEICKIFKSICFEESLRTPDSETTLPIPYHRTTENA